MTGETQMIVNFNIYSVVLLFGFIQGLIYTVLFLYRGFREQRKSDLMAGFLLGISCVMIMPYMLGFMGIPIMWTDLLFFPFDPGLLAGPVIYFYLKTLTDSDFYFRWKDMWHLLPFFLYAGYQLVVFSKGNDFVQHWLADVDIPYVQTPVMIVTLVSNYTYLYFTIRHYNQYRHWVSTQYSNPEEISFEWYRNYLILVGSAITLSWIFNSLEVAGISLSYTQNWWEYVFIVVVIYIFTIKGYLEKPRISIHFDPVKEQEIVSTNILPEGELSELKTALLSLMENEKAYLKPDLTLREVAVRLNTPSNTVSQTINQGFGKNFNQFINDFRVEEFKISVINPAHRHLSLLAIALDSGFNSKATFNRVFKRATGISPRQYLEENRPPE